MIALHNPPALILTMLVDPEVGRGWAHTRSRHEKALAFDLQMGDPLLPADGAADDRHPGTPVPGHVAAFSGYSFAGGLRPATGR
jgi:hypothetical protein